jgi:cytochrome c-type biogenesis protein CcmH
LEIKKITRQSFPMLVDIDTFYHGGKESTLADILLRSRMVLTCGGRRITDRSPDNRVFHCPINLRMLNISPQRDANSIFHQYRRFVIAILAVFLLLLALPASALAQDEDPPPGGPTDDQVNAIAEQLFCPVCENVPLDVCGTQACADWRDEIRQMLTEGQSEAEIKAYFTERYGRRVLATPERSGVDIFLWVLPPIGLVAGAVVLGLALRRMAPDALAAEVRSGLSLSYEGLDPEYVARIEEDLKEWT